MRVKRFVCASMVACGLFAGPAVASAFAQTPDAQAIRQEIDQLRRDFEALKQQYDDRLAALEGRLVTAQAGQSTAPTATAQAPVPPGAEGAGGPSGTLPVYGTTGAAVS